MQPASKVLLVLVAAVSQVCRAKRVLGPKGPRASAQQDSRAKPV